MRIQRRLALTGAAAAAATTLLAGCAGFGNGSSSTGDESTGQTGGGAGSDQAAAAAPAAPAAPKIKWTLMTMATKKLGHIMVNGEGMTIYRFDGDTPNSATSKCAGACAKTWPPVTIHSTNLVLKGFDATLLGRIKRADGSWQLTLHGWPLYTYAGDTKAGVWKGQGLKGKWFVAAADGSKALAAKSVASSRSGSSGSSGSSSGSSGSSGSGGSGSSGSSGSGGGYGGGYGTGGGGY
jgi:predicted lipoprotein with Yx(FWY)xxD motif